MMTPNINPGNKNYLSYQIDSSNHVILQPNFKSYLSMKVGKYALENHENSLPWADSEEYQGSILKESG